MSYTADQLLSFAHKYEKIASESLIKEAKKKETKKLDPKAKVRNRGTVCVPAEQAKDKKDHFPINDADQARNALARVHQYSSAPDWYKGSLAGLQALVARKVKAKYPKIDVGGKKKEKKSFIEAFDSLLHKYAQEQSYGDMNEYELAQLAQKGEDHPGIGSLKGEPWLKNLLNQGKIPERLYQAAAGVLRMMPGPGQQQPTIELDDPQPTPAPTRPSIPVRQDVQVAQRKLKGMGHNLGNTGPQGDGVDGQLGPKTIDALKKYKPSVGAEEAIKELNQPSGGIVRDAPF